MTKRIATVVEGVKDWLNQEARDWSLSFSAERYWTPVWQLKTAQNLAVLVAPMAPSGEYEVNPGRRQVTRGQKGFVFVVDIGVIKQVDPQDNTEVDPLMGLCEEIADAALDQAMGGAQCVRVDGPLWDPENLDSLKRFTGLVRLKLTTIE